LKLVESSLETAVCRRRPSSRFEADVPRRRRLVELDLQDGTILDGVPAARGDAAAEERRGRGADEGERGERRADETCDLALDVLRAGVTESALALGSTVRRGTRRTSKERRSPVLSLIPMLHRLTGPSARSSSTLTSSNLTPPRTDMTGG